MRNHSVRILGLAIAALAFSAASVEAQGQGHGKHAAKAEHGKKAGKVKVKEGRELRRSDGDVLRDRDRDVYDRRDGDVYRDRDARGNGVKVPPGLAKKPGQMPPGQYKKRYDTNQGADVLGGVLRRRGYDVTRVVPAGESQYVFYRLRDGQERRAIVSPGTDRLVFRNVPSSLLQEVLAALR